MKIEICPECFDKLVEDLQSRMMERKLDEVDSITYDSGLRAGYISENFECFGAAPTFPETITLELDGSTIVIEKGTAAPVVLGKGADEPTIIDLGDAIL